MKPARKNVSFGGVMRRGSLLERKTGAFAAAVILLAGISGCGVKPSQSGASSAGEVLTLRDADNVQKGEAEDLTSEADDLSETQAAGMEKVYEDTEEYGRILVIDREEYFTPLYKGKEQQYVELSLNAEPEEPYILRIPSVYNGTEVLYFSDISNSEYVKEIVVPDGVLCPHIEYCPILERVEIGAIDADRFTDIWMELNGREDREPDIHFIVMLFDCPMLTEVEFHEGAEYGWLDISSCPVGEVEIPPSVQWLTIYSATPLSSVESATVPEGVTRLMGSFDACPNLTDVTLLCSAVEIEYSFGMFCDSLEHVQLPSGVISLTGTFDRTESLRWVELSEGTEAIKYYSFYECPKLQWVIVPASVTVIDEDCFQNCPELTLVVQPDSYAEQFAQEQDIPYIYEADFDRQYLEEGDLK